MDGFECHCQYGFFGDTCEWNIDDCDENACANNSTCQDGAANYTCLCKEGLKGDLCEIAMGKLYNVSIVYLNYLARNYFVSTEISSLMLRSCKKFLHGGYCLCAARDNYRATPNITQDLD